MSKKKGYSGMIQKRQANIATPQRYDDLLRQWQETSQQLKAIAATVNLSGLTATQREAARRGIHPGNYSEIDVLLAIEEVAEQRDALWKRGMDDIGLFGSYLFAIEKLIDSIDKRVLVYRDDELKEHLNEGDAGELSGLLIEAGIVSERVGQPIDALALRVKRRTQGIRSLLNDDDDGTALRAAALDKDEDSANIAVNFWRENLKINSRNKSGWREWLRHRWKTIELESPDKYAAEVRIMILDEIAPRDPNNASKRSLIDPQNSNHAGAFKSLTQAKTSPADYRAQLFKDV